MSRSIHWLWLIVAVVVVVGIAAGLWAWRHHAEQAQVELYRQEAVKTQQQEGS
ncbi:hypothetical protein HRbin17_02329 [bacterium HR17]|uniref:Uncharacterized protein n=1 Tax=Candidatus Fervidibacter japonicus TaxID=2035412 RepID=A0A2H5XF27_9BACT|nr:hypothetical protein HRbin17_02329 [bacterium HR17]